MFAYNLGHFRLTSIQFRRFAAFFIFYLAVFVRFRCDSCICTKFCCFEFWRQNDDKPGIHYCRQSTATVFRSTAVLKEGLAHALSNKFLFVLFNFLYFCVIPVFRISLRIQWRTRNCIAKPRVR